MAASDAQAVLDRMAADEDFAQRVKEAGGPKASVALLRDEGFEVTQQEMRDAVLDRYGADLTPEQRDDVAGGVGGAFDYSYDYDYVPPDTYN